MEEFEIQLKQIFLQEASEMLDKAESAFLEMEHSANNAELINQIFRLAHNIKGSAKAVGFAQVNIFAHEFENLLLNIKEGVLPVTRSIIDLMLECIDQLRLMANGLTENFDAEFNFSELIAKVIETYTSRPSEVATEFPAEPGTDFSQEINYAPSDFTDLSIENKQIESTELTQNLITEGKGFHIFDEETTEGNQVHSVSNSHKITHEKNLGLPKSISSSQESKRANQDEVVRVSLARLERLINDVGELVILQNMIAQEARDIGDQPHIKSVRQLMKVSRSIRETAMSLRMVSMKPLFQKLQRIVRDTANALDKDCKINVLGEDSELDKSIFERLSDPLTHMVRNAIDHGIETKDERIKAGKIPEGHIEIHAFSRADRLIIEIKDDGRGLDQEKLRKKAIDKGIIKSVSDLSKEQIFELIFIPGFSTKDKVSDISGRGVGMDVVRTSISSLGGHIKISSDLGKGSIFSIELPMSLAIVDGMIVRSGNDRYVVPLSQVHELLRLNEDSVFHSQEMGEVIMLRSENIPIYYLADLLRQQQSILVDNAEIPVAVIRDSEIGNAALAFDEILGRTQVVIKNLGQELHFVKGISGTTILADGNPALVLNLKLMIQNFGRSKRSEPRHQKVMAS